MVINDLMIDAGSARGMYRPSGGSDMDNVVNEIISNYDIRKIIHFIDSAVRSHAPSGTRSIVGLVPGPFYECGDKEFELIVRYLRFLGYVGAAVWFYESEFYGDGKMVKFEISW